MAMILVTGASGRLGGALLDRLAGQGERVRALSRRARSGGGAEWVRGDLSSGEGLEAALDGIGTVIHGATTIGRADSAATERLLQVARRAGVRHFVYVSIVGVDAIPFFYYRTKLECERLVAASGIPWTVLRATQFHELLAQIFAVQRFSPVLLTVSGLRFQPVDTTEVAERLALLAGGPAQGMAAEIGGPEVLGMRELNRRYARSRGWHKPVLTVPGSGTVLRRFREGHNLTPEHADGTIGFARFLAEGAGK
ncbi:SDR family oxidoreductase [Sciscionella marina]|uniref:SDR family oxidoreductase n=1 Tax=Sciscionella marina TaxID=508770 RepID=UPI000370627C|nr:NAD(P)H-binding protein [Sciscionella marina]